MRFSKRLVYGIGFLVSVAVVMGGCTQIGTTSKAPITVLPTGGTVSERQQQYLLKQIKWRHESGRGKIQGAQHFVDSQRPIAGAREKDTLEIKSGPYKGSYKIAKMIRLISKSRRGKRRRQVIVKIVGRFIPKGQDQNWTIRHKGSGGLTLKDNIFTDEKSFLPDVPMGTQLLLRTGGKLRTYTIIKTQADTFGLKKIQRIGYTVAEKLPAGLRNMTYQVRIPNPKTASNLPYSIGWRGSALTGHNFTIGINRRRYGQDEIEDLLKSRTISKKQLASLKAKRGTATVLQLTGGIAIVLGGFLALVRRDDFQGSAQAIPWSIVGGGVVFVLSAIPFTVSANNDYLQSAQAYNHELLKRLRLPMPKKLAKKNSKKNIRVATPPKASSDIVYTQK